jgi:hypothetical protein
MWHVLLHTYTDNARRESRCHLHVLDTIASPFVARVSQYGGEISQTYRPVNSIDRYIASKCGQRPQQETSRCRLDKKTHRYV